MAAKSEQLQIRVTPEQKAVLKRLARRAGVDVSSYVLSRALPSARVRLTSILSALGREDDRRYALAELSDLLSSLAPVEFQATLADLGLEHLEPWLKNYVAAMVEHAASRKGEAPPAWVRDIEPLETPHFAVSLPKLRPYLLRVSPVAFKRRNIFVDSTVGDRV